MPDEPLCLHEYFFSNHVFYPDVNKYKMNKYKIITSKYLHLLYVVGRDSILSYLGKIQLLTSFLLPTEVWTIEKNLK